MFFKDSFGRRFSSHLSGEMFSKFFWSKLFFRVFWERCLLICLVCFQIILWMLFFLKAPWECFFELFGGNVY